MEDFFERLERMENGTPDERLVAALWNDVTDRRGWRQAADQFDDDVRHEILDTWLSIVAARSATTGEA